MKLNKRLVGIVVLVGLLVGSLAIGAALAGKPGIAVAAPPAQTNDENEANEAGEKDETNEGSEANEANEANEAAETETGEQNEQDGAVPKDWTGLTLDEAKAVAEAANPGTAVKDAEFEQESGTAVFEIELDNGVELVIDAVTGDIITSATDTD